MGAKWVQVVALLARLLACPLVAGVPDSGVVLLWWCVPLSIVAYFLPKQGETWQKLDFICSLWCFLGDLGDNKRQKPKIFLKCGDGKQVKYGRLPALLACISSRLLVAYVPALCAILLTLAI